MKVIESKRKRPIGWLEMRVALYEKQVLIRLMRKTKGHIKEAARLAGREPKYLSRLLAFYGIDPKSFKDSKKPAREQWRDPSKMWKTKRRLVRETANARDRVDATILPRQRRTYFGVAVE